MNIFDLISSKAITLDFDMSYVPSKNHKVFYESESGTEEVLNIEVGSSVCIVTTEDGGEMLQHDVNSVDGCYMAYRALDCDNKSDVTLLDTFNKLSVEFDEQVMKGQITPTEYRERLQELYSKTLTEWRANS